MTDVLSSPCSSTSEPAPGTARTVCRPVRDAAELAQHLRVRHDVFVREQGLFADDDADEHDHDPSTVHVLALVDGRPSGSVRLYPLPEPGLWKGDRLAVLPEHRRSRLGGPLVRLAVALAGARGGARMVAHVQAPNTRFFVALGWAPVGAPFDLLGVPHQQMSIALAP